jgi:hypothetical protein
MFHAKLSMFLDQHGGKSSPNHVVSQATFELPFKKWKAGYVVVASRSDSDEEWVIKSIQSADGVLRRDDCSVTLINKATEVREVKGSTLQGSYKFKSTGDLPAPEMTELAEGRTDVKPIGVDPRGVREFYPRQKGEGTRILMNDKTTYIVCEPFDVVWRKFAAVGAALAKLNHTGVVDHSLILGN